MTSSRRVRSLGLLAVGLFGAGLGGAACSRAHLTSTHGRAYREVFAAQDANPNRGTPKSVHGLDSQEAAIIAGNYRRELSPQAAASPQSQQLLMTNPAAAPAPPPSSVPNGN
jgi:hypothetical protein